jgi:predicted amidohydrolase YtcJ
MMVGPETRLLFERVGMVTGAGDSRLRLGAVKFLLEVEPDQDEINAAALECHLAGWQLAFHAIAESTVEAAVKALEHVNSRSPTAGRRHRIEHCGECPPHLIERLHRLGAIIVTQPPFIYSSGERYLATVNPAQLPWLYRIRSPLEAGVTVAGGSDAPVAPLDPLVGIYAAVNRRAESGQVLLPGEVVSAEQALALYTSNAACAAFEENDRGSISPGRLADIIVLSEDPIRVSPERINDIKVVMTIIGGEVVWEG